MERIRIVLPVLTAAVLAAMAVPATADPGATTHVDSVTATVAGAVVSVTGQATFVDVPVTVATDASGDAVPNGLATDLASATIARPDPAKSELRFSIRINDPLPTVFGVPETVHYSFFFAVGGQGWLLISAANAAANAANGGAPVGPMFRLDRFNGTSCCSIIKQVPGTMASGQISFTTTFSDLGLQPGATVEPHSRAIQIQLGASGVSRLNNGQPDLMTMTTAYTVPGATVELGIAPAGTAPDQIPLTATSTVSGGNFSGSLATPASPGDYVVAAKACFGPQSCGPVATTTVTVV